nr:MAG TPA: hypothetical protein [Caudoviricetes sp.]
MLISVKSQHCPCNFLILNHLRLHNHSSPFV